ncbi:MAG: YadA-like family protein [Sodalis sp. (in: enterobacteria)]
MSKKAVLLAPIVASTMLPNAAIADKVIKFITSKNAYMIGENAKADKKNTLALGYAAHAKNKSSTALGHHALADRLYTYDTQKKLEINYQKILCIKGSRSSINLMRFLLVECLKKLNDSFFNKLSQVTNVAPGIKDTDGVNLFQTTQIATMQAEKIRENLEAAHSSMNNQTRINSDRINHTENLIHDNAKQVQLIFEKLKGSKEKLIEYISQGKDNTIYIGNTLEGGVLMVSGNKGDRVISGASAGIKNHDVANIAQLNQVKDTAMSAHAIAEKNTSLINNMKSELHQTNSKMDYGLAASAALSGLFQPYGVGKVNVTAGIAGCGSSQAIAVGSGYRFAENAAVKAGLAYSNKNNVIYNASFNLEW